MSKHHKLGQIHKTNGLLNIKTIYRAVIIKSYKGLILRWTNCGKRRMDFKKGVDINKYFCKNDYDGNGRRKYKEEKF